MVRIAHIVAERLAFGIGYIIHRVGAGQRHQGQEYKQEDGSSHR